MVNTVKFSDFANGSLANSTNTIVGTTASSGGTNVKFDYPPTWTTSTRPALTSRVLGYNSDLSQYEFSDGTQFVQLAAGGSGTVNAGTQNQLAYYAANGTAVSGLFSNSNGVLVTDSSGVPSISSTLPSSLTIPTPTIQGVTNGGNASSGVVGQVLSSVITAAFAVPLTVANTAYNITNISLTAGDWDVWGNVFFIISSQTAVSSFYAWTSQSSTPTLPDFSLVAGDVINSTSFTGGTGVAVPSVRVSLSGPASIYLQAQTTAGSVGTFSACGGIYARRRR